MFCQWLTKRSWLDSLFMAYIIILVMQRHAKTWNVRLPQDPVQSPSQKFQAPTQEWSHRNMSVYVLIANILWYSNIAYYFLEGQNRTK